MNDRISNEPPNRAPTEEQTPALSAKRASLLFIIFIALQFVIALLISLPIGIYIGATASEHTDSSTALALLSQLELPIASISLLLSALTVFWMTRNNLPGSLASGALASLGWKSTSHSSLLIASLIGAVIATGFLSLLVPAFPPAEGQPWGAMTAAAQSNDWQRYYWVVLVLFIAPPIEEFIFRGMLFTGLSNAFSTLIAAAIVTGLFVMVHVFEAMHYWPAWVGIFLLAVATMIMRIKFQSLLPALATHFSYNLVIVLFVFNG